MAGKTQRSRGQPPPPRTETVKLIYEFLADGEWHEEEEIRKAVYSQISPGEAWRCNEKERLSQLKYRARRDMTAAEFKEWVSDPENLRRRRPITLEEGVAAGRNVLLRRAMRKHNDRRIEQAVINDRTMWRLRPHDDYFTRSVSARLRKQFLEENPQATEDDIRKYINRVQATYHRDRKRAQGLRRTTVGGRTRWVPIEPDN